MYKCRFSKAIWKDESKSKIYEVLVKSIELPFPPYLGLSIRSDRFTSGEITSVLWDAEAQEFHLAVIDEIPWIDQEGHLHTAEQMRDHYLKRCGWEVCD